MVMEGIEEAAGTVGKGEVAGGERSKPAADFYAYEENFSSLEGSPVQPLQHRSDGLARYRVLLKGHVSRAALGLALIGACLWCLGCGSRSEGTEGEEHSLDGASGSGAFVDESAVQQESGRDAQRAAGLSNAPELETREAPVAPYPQDPAIPSFLLPQAKTGEEADEPVLDDFSTIVDSEQRKARFFAFLRPLVETENKRLEAERQALERLFEKFRRLGNLNPAELAWLQERAAQYRLGDLPIPSEEVFRRLLQRIDSLPVELVLSQAAFESGWGSSRFAQEGFNLFGEWCFEAGCGLVPTRREAGARHEVAVFESPRRSVQSYMRNLNTHPAYQDLRLLRTEKRRQGERADGFTLAAGLMGYSEMGQEYVERLCLIMRHNQSLIEGRGHWAAL